MIAGQPAIASATARPKAALLRASALLLAVAAASKLTTVAADSFVAAKFGLSADADAYLLAIGLLGVLIGGPGETLRLAMVPTCGEYIRRGDRRGAAGVLVLALVVVLLLGGAAAAGVAILMPWIGPLAAPGFDGERLGTLSALMCVLAAALVLSLVMALLLGVLHAQLRFGATAVAGLGLGGGVIAGGVLLGDRLGVASLALGYVGGTTAVVLVLAWLARALFAEGAAVRGALVEMKPFVRLAVPVGAAISIVSAGAFIERAVASATGSGNVAALGYAIKLITQAAIVSQSVWTPLTPLLTASGTPAHPEGDGRLVAFSIRLMLLTLVPATAALIALREPLVAVIYQRGAFAAADTGRTAALLALHSGSLLGEGLFMVAVAALLSFRDAGTRLVASGLFLASKIAFMGMLTPVLGVAGIALASSASSLLAGAYAVRVLSRRLSGEERRDLLAMAYRVAIGGLAACCVAAALVEAMALAGMRGTLEAELGRLAVGALAAGLTYAVVLSSLGVAEVNALLARARARLPGAACR